MLYSRNERNAANQLYLSGSDGKESARSAGDLGSIPESGRSPEGNGNPLQYSSLENSMGSGAWKASVRGVAKSQTRLSNYHMPYCAAEMNTALQIQPRILTNQSISKANNSLLYVESKKQNQ